MIVQRPTHQAEEIPVFQPCECEKVLEVGPCVVHPGQLVPSDGYYADELEHQTGSRRLWACAACHQAEGFGYRRIK